MSKTSLLETLSEADITSIAKIIVSRSAYFAEKFPFLTIDDCMQVSWRELIQYQSYYDSGKGKITSWVYGLVTNTLTSYAQKEFKKTQKWDNIEDFVFKDEKVETPGMNCSYDDFVQLLKSVLSPRCFDFLKLLEVDPKACLSSLTETLGLSERNLLYLRNELRETTRHMLLC